ncbi:MAG: hypothetical protein RIF41_17015 [Polyangiaceae bacterium]
MVPPRLALRAIVLSLVAAGCTPKVVKGNEPAEGSVTPTPPAAASPEGNVTVRYRFDVKPDRLRAEVCFDRGVAERLVPPMSRAIPFLVGATHHGRDLEVEDGELSLATLQPGDCLEYAVDVEALLRRRSTWDGVGRVGDDLLLSPDWWLWVPEPRGSGTSIRARFDGGMEASMPWPRSGGAYPFTIPESTFTWKAQGAFGRFEHRALTLRDAELSVTTVGDGFGERTGAVNAWLDRSAHAVADLLGGFPVSQAQVLLVADPDRHRSFGYALRGGGPSTALLLPSRPSQPLLDEDWTAAHELLHFSLPPLPTSDAWLYEGLTTYLTAVARARAGIISEDEGWWELLDGFERGSRVGTGVSLRKESEQMHDNRTYWRVYWSGAALMLQIDVELREQGMTLAEIVSRFAAQRPGDDHDWNAAEVVAQLSKLCGSEMPAEVVARHLDAKDFPDTTALRAALGVQLEAARAGKRAGKTVRYDDTAPNAAIRKAIMRRVR